MALKDPVAGLRPLFLNSKSAAKIEVRVPPGAVVAASEDLAAELIATGAGFEDYDAQGVAVFDAIAEQQAVEQAAGLAAGTLDGEADPAAAAAALTESVQAPAKRKQRKPSRAAAAKKTDE